MQYQIHLMNLIKKIFRVIPSRSIELRKFTIGDSYNKIAIDVALILLITIMIVIYKANK
jgi:hypothetical protein